jgi:hypothetical protein
MSDREFFLSTYPEDGVQRKPSHPTGQEFVAG